MERMRRRRQDGNGGASEEEESARTSAPPSGGAVQVIWGASADSFDLGDMTVGDAFRMLSAPLHIAGGVAALVNGEVAGADRRLAAGDVLEFARPAGEKGARA